MKSKTAPASRSHSTGKRKSGQGVRSWQIWVGIGALVVVAIMLIVAFVASVGGSGTIEGLRTYGSLSRDHTLSPVAYAQVPPVGGAHHPTWQNCGIYDEPVPNEKGVHALEHGAVWITYRPDLPAGALEQLRSLVRGHSHALLSPYVDLPAPVVASAWGIQVQVEDAADAGLGKFLAAYEQGAQTPEPGAACTGGDGTPIDG